MATKTRRIGLSLGADICWPVCYENLLKQLDLSIPVAQIVSLVVVGAIVGLLAAILPARRASRLNVLEAIAYE